MEFEVLRRIISGLLLPLLKPSFTDTGLPVWFRKKKKFYRCQIMSQLIWFTPTVDNNVVLFSRSETVTGMLQLYD